MSRAKYLQRVALGEGHRVLKPSSLIHKTPRGLREPASLQRDSQMRLGTCKKKTATGHFLLKGEGKQWGWAPGSAPALPKQGRRPPQIQGTDVRAAVKAGAAPQPCHPTQRAACAPRAQDRSGSQMSELLGFRLLGEALARSASEGP